MSKIIRLESTNYKRLKAVHIAPDPDGNLVIVAGRNGQGKSSILDSITAALGGVNAKTTPKPIRDGEERAEIVLETEDLIVTRKFTASGSTLVVKSPDGAVYPKGQAKLDDLLGKLSLDPLAFTQLSDRDQLATLLDLVELPFDPVVLDVERRTFFDQRTAVNRALKELEVRLVGREVKEGDPVEEVSVNSLLTQIEAARAIQRDYDADVQDLGAAQDEVARLKEELAAATTNLKSMEAAVAKWQGKQIPDVAALTEKVANAEQTNRAARANAEWLHVKKQRDDTKSTSAKLTAEIESIDKRRAEGLAAAVFPVDELGFDESGVTFKGVPFKQASSAEQLRVSLAMAIALNPKLRVIRIADGSLLDSDNLALVEAVAKENDFQVWIEMVGEGDERGIIIEDGEVKA